MIARRLPIAVLLVVIGLVALVLDPRTEQVAVESDIVNAAALSPLATGESGGSSTWFCAGGSALGNGPADQTVVVANPTADAVTGVLQVFVEGQDPKRVPLSVGAHDQARVALSSVARGEWAAALVEVDHGGVVVTHEVRGVGGWDSDRCSSQAATRWFFPWGQTTPQDASSLRLALFNPFPAEAVVDITFDTDDGFRAPEALQGFLVPARRLVTVDVTAIVPIRQRISTSVSARSGRLVVDRIQSLTGTDGTVTLDVTPGAPRAAQTWYFADGRVDAATFERIAVFNPGEETALVEVAVERPRSTQELGIEPFELQIPSQSYAEVVLNDQGRIPKPLRHSTVVRSLNNVAVVAERVQLSGTVVAAAVPVAGSADGSGTAPNTNGAAAAAGAAGGLVLGALPPGLSASLGTPVAATDWVLALPARAELAEAKVVVRNVWGDQPVSFRVSAWSKARSVDLKLTAALTGLAPGQQVEVPLAGVGDGPLMLRLSATGPVVVDGVLVFGPVPDTSFAPAVPLPVGVVVPGPLGVIDFIGLPPTAVPSTTVPATTTTVAPTTTALPTTTSVVTVTTTTAAGATTTVAGVAPTTTTVAAAATTTAPRA